MARKMVYRAFFAPVRYPLPEKEIKFAAQAQRSLEEFAGFKVQSYSWGEGPAVIFMHGWSSRTTQFHPMIKAFTAAGYRCTGIDAPSHGFSPGKEADIFSFGNTLLDFGKTQAPVHAIISHSMGGAAAIYALGRGLQAGKLVVMNTPVIASEIIQSSCRMLNASKKMEQRLKEEIYRRYGAYLEDYTAAALAAGVRIPPALLIYDQQDKDAPPHNAEVLKKAIGSAQVVITKGLGHTRSLRDEAVTRKALEFIQS
jgi:pimeloyl-ACP methyl ester carboxylesterase